MTRILTLALVLFTSTALAQPGGDGGKPLPRGRSSRSPRIRVARRPTIRTPIRRRSPSRRRARPTIVCRAPIVEAPPPPPPANRKPAKPAKPTPKAKPPKADRARPQRSIRLVGRPAVRPAPSGIRARRAIRSTRTRRPPPIHTRRPRPWSPRSRPGRHLRSHAVQGLLAVQRLDGWLLFDRDGENPIASRLVEPEGHPTRPCSTCCPRRASDRARPHRRAAQLRSPARQEAHLPRLSRSRQAAQGAAQGHAHGRARVLAEGRGAQRLARRRRTSSGSAPRVFRSARRRRSSSSPRRSGATLAARRTTSRSITSSSSVGTRSRSSPRRSRPGRRSPSTICSSGWSAG